MTVSQHRSLHMGLERRGKRNTPEHNRKIGEGKKAFHAHGPRKIRIVLDVTARLCDTMAEAAKWIGCSRQLVSQVLKRNSRNRTACGFRIEFADGDKETVK